MTVLYDYWRSSTAYRVRIALHLAGIPFETVSVNLLSGAQRSPENLARNPQGLVPTLEIDGLTLTQSLAIVEYLDETRKAGFLPADPVARARVRALSYAVAMEIHPVCNQRVAKFATNESQGAITTETWMRHFIRLGLEGVEGLLKSPATGRFCHGNTPTMADISLVPQGYNARRWGVDLQDFPRISAVLAEAGTHPAFLAAVPVEPAAA